MFNQIKLVLFECCIFFFLIFIILMAIVVLNMKCPMSLYKVVLQIQPLWQLILYKQTYNFKTLVLLLILLLMANLHKLPFLIKIRQYNIINVGVENDFNIIWINFCDDTNQCNVKRTYCYINFVRWSVPIGTGYILVTFMTVSWPAYNLNF